LQGQPDAAALGRVLGGVSEQVHDQEMPVAESRREIARRFGVGDEVLRAKGAPTMPVLPGIMRRTVPKAEQFASEA
jgi:hypothetical protein